ncbi:MAG: hypothetical protein JOY66_24280 [Acetobacteraceae bacterium]|nr:hypothetical protein [Acetobacteraceae bacterium]
MSDQTPKETELRIELAEARTDKKFAAMLGEMRTGFARLDARLDGVERATSGIKATVIGTGIAAVVLVIAVLAYGQTWFGIGVSTRDVVRAAVTEYRQQAISTGTTKPP